MTSSPTSRYKSVVENNRYKRYLVFLTFQQYLFVVGIVVLLVLCYVGYDYISITEELMEYEAKEKLRWDSEVYGYG